MTIEELDAIATPAFGRKWAVPLADGLSLHAGRKVSAAQINHWQAGLRPVPTWVPDALVRSLFDRAYSLQRQARATYNVAMDLERRLAPPLPPRAAPEPQNEPIVEDDGPSPQM